MNLVHQIYTRRLSNSTHPPLRYRQRFKEDNEIIVPSTRVLDFIFQECNDIIGSVWLLNPMSAILILLPNDPHSQSLQNGADLSSQRNVYDFVVEGVAKKHRRTGC